LYVYTAPSSVYTLLGRNFVLHHLDEAYNELQIKVGSVNEETLNLSTVSNYHSLFITYMLN